MVNLLEVLLLKVYVYKNFTCIIQYRKMKKSAIPIEGMSNFSPFMKSQIYPMAVRLLSEYLKVQKLSNGVSSPLPHPAYTYM